MPRVRSYRRRDGSRVRSHLRRGRGRSPRRRTARRPRRSAVALPHGVAPKLAVLVVGGTAVLGAVVFVQRHPVWSLFIALLLCVAAGAAYRAVSTQRAARHQRAARMAASIEVTDSMTGPQFERWVAAVLTASGFQQVRTCGGAGDRGADIIARTPSGHRVVVQCKRQSPQNPVGSAAVQRFAGTCRSIHGGDLCLIVTNGRFSNGDGVRLARELDIVLVDRAQLASWAADRVPPPALANQLARHLR